MLFCCNCWGCGWLVVLVWKIVRNLMWNYWYGLDVLLVCFVVDVGWWFCICVIYVWCYGFLVLVFVNIIEILYSVISFIIWLMVMLGFFVLMCLIVWMWMFSFVVVVVWFLLVLVWVCLMVVFMFLMVCSVLVLIFVEICFFWVMRSIVNDEGVGLWVCCWVFLVWLYLVLLVVRWLFFWLGEYVGEVVLVCKVVVDGYFC